VSSVLPANCFGQFTILHLNGCIANVSYITFPGFCTLLLVTLGVIVPFTCHFNGTISTTKLCIKSGDKRLCHGRSLVLN
jgi:hypothetical protein